MFRDDGAGSAIDTEVNSTNDSNIRDKPTLFSMQVTSYPTSPTGSTFYYKVQAINAVGSVYST